MKKGTLLIWIGILIWIMMIVVKAIIIFTHTREAFQWDPMFLFLPLILVYLGGKSNEKEKDEEEPKEKTSKRKHH